MLGLSLTGVRSLVAVGAHPDDIEIAAGGLLLSLAAASPGVRVHYVLCTGSPERQAEARAAAAAFLPGADLSFDLHRRNVYLRLADDVARRKVELLHASFPSQKARDWWDDEVFLGLARLRGMECRSRYAEAFDCAKAVLRLA